MILCKVYNFMVACLLKVDPSEEKSSVGKKKKEKKKEGEKKEKKENKKNKIIFSVSAVADQSLCKYQPRIYAVKCQTSFSRESHGPLSWIPWNVVHALSISACQFELARWHKFSQVNSHEIYTHPMFNLHAANFSKCVNHETVTTDF